MIRILLAVFLFAGTLLAADAARNRTPGSSNVRQGATLPSTCRPSPDADVFYKSGASAGLYVCSATNTMTAHGLPTGASAVWVAGGTGDWAALNGTQTVTWASTTT